MIRRNNIFLYLTVMLVITWHEIFTASGQNNVSNEEMKHRIQYSKVMQSYMNMKVEACDDFYEYACGNWKNHISSEETREKRVISEQLEEKIMSDIIGILKRPNVNDVAPEYSTIFGRVKNFYSNCLSTQASDVKAPLEYIKVLKEIGGFPAVDKKWNKNNFDWLEMSAHLSNYDVPSFVVEDIAISHPFKPHFQIPKIGFGTGLIDDTNGKQNMLIMTVVLQRYGVQKEESEEIAHEIYNFLKKITPTLNEIENNPNKCHQGKESDLKNLKTKWKKYYDIAWSGINFEKLHYNPEHKPCQYLYLKINEVCAQNQKAAANYLALKFLYHMEIYRGNRGRMSEQFCTRTIYQSAKYLVDHIYMKLHFKEPIRKEVEHMAVSIRESLGSLLQKANWLDESTRKKALQKKSQLGIYIGRYEQPAITRQLIQEMNNIKYVKDQFALNYLTLRKFTKSQERYFGRNYEKLEKSKPLEHYIGLQETAAYDHRDNSMYVHAATLFKPHYMTYWPKSLKYGALGSVIGHEFTHAFDTEGALHAVNGELMKWWSRSTEHNFKTVSKCYVDHYSNYIIPEIRKRIDGKRTQNENIADAGGLRAAFMAYKQYTNGLTNNFSPNSPAYKNEQMPNLQLSPERLFFLGFAQMWCSLYTKDDYLYELEDEHTVNKYRVLGALSNNEDFASAYGCPVRSKMNPQIKCKLW